MMVELSRARNSIRWGMPEVAGIVAAAACLAIVVLKQPGIYRAVLGLVELAPLVVVAVWDMRTLRAPNRLVYPALAFVALASCTLGWRDALEAWLGGLVTFMVLFIVALAGRGAMGYADVKVGAICGVVVGLRGTVPLLLLTFIGGAGIALVLLALRIRRRKDALAFTPFLVAATILSLGFFQLYLWS
jgi:prepilin signal peptidase PulO-like enzyme (type II secretory pathway)